MTASGYWACIRAGCDFRGETTGDAGEHDNQPGHATHWVDE